MRLSWQVSLVDCSGQPVHTRTPVATAVDGLRLHSAPDRDWPLSASRAVLCSSSIRPSELVEQLSGCLRRQTSQIPFPCLR